jgi:serine/threonine-protein kinase
VSKIICPGCRAAFDADTNFCSRCGASLQATPSADRERRTEPAMSVPDVLSAMIDEPPPPQRDPLIGRVIDGRYKVIERLGTGGMGIVYKVEHQRMGKIAAMKVLHRDLAHDKEVMKRFRREAEAVSKLTHPNTVQTFDFGMADGALYLVMEYVRGEDLGALLRRDGPLPWRKVAPIFISVCDALAEAHELGIVHRDLKPENILVIHTKDGHDHPKVLDFGLAKLSEPGATASPEVTGRGEIVGTPFYMSPEQIRGEELDHRADIYSLGAVIYRVLTGEPPFQAQSPVGVLTKHLTDELVAPTRRRPDLELPARVDAIVARAMAKQREDRYPTITELRDELAAAMGDITARRAAMPTTTPQRLVRPAHPSSAQPRLLREDFDAFERSLRRRGFVRTMLVPLVIGAAALGGVVYWRYQAQQPKSVEVEPNNDLATATPIAPGVEVRGAIGQRQSAAEGDRDYFRLATGAAPGQPRRVRAALGAIPNIDLSLAVFDRYGRFLAVAEARPTGEPETLAGLDVEDETVFLAVLEKKDSATVPTENLSDEYRLTVSVGEPIAEPPAPEPEKERARPEEKSSR